jgi:P-type conjugative transfer protein TrbJ
VTCTRRVDLARIASALALTCAPLLAAGQWVVFDPSNFARNTVTSAQSVKAEIQRAQQIANQIRQYVVEAQQYAAMVQMLRKMQPQDIAWNMLRADEDLRRIMDYGQTLATLYVQLGDLQLEIQRIGGAKSLSGLTWEEYARRERMLSMFRARGNLTAFEQAQVLMQRVQKTYERVRDVQPRIPSAEPNQAMQMMNEQMSMQLSQQAAFMAYTARKDSDEAALREQQELSHAQVLAERETRAARAETMQAQTDTELEARRARIQAVFGRGGN